MSTPFRSACRGAANGCWLDAGEIEIHIDIDTDTEIEIEIEILALRPSFLPARFDALDEKRVL